MPLSTAATFHNAPFRECRRVNRIAVLFAALHMSAHGTKRRFATVQKFGSYREDSGHSAGSGGSPIRQN
jgi:hypothetical protein